VKLVGALLRGIMHLCLLLLACKAIEARGLEAACDLAAAVVHEALGDSCITNHLLLPEQPPFAST
jgi:hypothetical protein